MSSLRKKFKLEMIKHARYLSTLGRVQSVLSFESGVQFQAFSYYQMPPWSPEYLPPRISKLSELEELSSGCTTYVGLE